MRPEVWIESPQAECEENVDRYAAIAGYLKSKFRLQGSQKQAWQKIEEAAEPALESIHELCAPLPDRMAGPPAAPDMLDFPLHDVGGAVGLPSVVMAALLLSWSFRRAPRFCAPFGNRSGLFMTRSHRSSAPCCNHRRPLADCEKLPKRVGAP